MPEKINIDDMFVLKFNAGSDTVDMLPGRDVYNEASFTMLNKRPVDELRAHIIKGVTVDPVDTAPFTPKLLCENILIDGSLVIFSYGDTVEFLTDVEIIDEGLAYQWLNVGAENESCRMFSLSYDGTDPYWQVVEYTGLGTDKEQTVDEYTLTIEQVYIFPNDKGILFYPQLMYRHLEHIELTVKEQTKKENLKTIVTGYTGNIQQAKREFAKDNRVIFMDGDNVKVLDVSNPDLLQKLFDQTAILEPKYLASCHLSHPNDVSGVSGRSRKYLMTPMTSFVDTVRTQMTTIYSDFGHTVTFSKSIVDDVDEKSKEYDLLFKAKTDGAITEDEFNTKVSSVLI